MSQQSAGEPEERTLPKRQRVAAYALIRRGEGPRTEILLAHLSPMVPFDGWTLPGGGVDHGEGPRDCLRREIEEETGLSAEPGRILDVYSHHFTGARPDGLIEDFHGIGLIYEAELDPGSADAEPRSEVAGSTDEARWHRLEDAAELKLTGAARFALRLLGVETHIPEEYNR